jgi:hypothetical protein
MALITMSNPLPEPGLLIAERHGSGTICARNISDLISDKFAVAFRQFLPILSSVYASLRHTTPDTLGVRRKSWGDRNVEMFR